MGTNDYIEWIENEFLKNYEKSPKELCAEYDGD